MRNVLSWFLVSLFLVSLTTGSWAFWGEENGKTDPGKPGEYPGARMVKALNLTEEQAARFKAGKEALMAKTKETHEANKVLKDKMAEELAKDNPDRAVLVKCIEEINANETALQIARTDQMLELHKLLTPEQREKMKEMKEKGKEKMKEKRTGSRPRKK